MGAARVNLPLAALPGVPEVGEQGWEGAQAGKSPSGSGDPFCAASPEGGAVIEQLLWSLTGAEHPLLPRTIYPIVAAPKDLRCSSSLPYNVQISEVGSWRGGQRHSSGREAPSPIWQFFKHTKSLELPDVFLLPWDGQAGEHLGIIGNRDLSAGSWARQEPFAASTQSPTSEPAQSGSG